MRRWVRKTWQDRITVGERIVWTAGALTTFVLLLVEILK